MEKPDTDITRLLNDVAGGDRGGEADLLRLVYRELHQLAEGYMKRERRDHTLQPTALVNEAYLRLVGDRAISWKSRTHFYVTAARTMRRILIDHARRKAAARRGSDADRVVLDDRVAVAEFDREQLLAIDQALTRLAALDARQAEVVELRFFAGLSVEETAAALGISEKTVKRDWVVARAFLQAELEERRSA